MTRWEPLAVACLADHEWPARWPPTVDQAPAASRVHAAIHAPDDPRQEGDGKTEKADCQLNVSHPFVRYLLRYLLVCCLPPKR